MALDHSPHTNCIFEGSEGSPPALPLERLPAALEVLLAASMEDLPEAGTLDAAYLAPLANVLSLEELRRFLHRACFLLKEGGELAFAARDPDEFPADLWPGEEHAFRSGAAERFRPLRHFVELLRLFPCRLRTPRAVELSRPGRFLLWRAVRAKRDDRPSDEHRNISEKYGGVSGYRRFDRLEEPEIADDLLYAASRLHPRPGERVLSLGMNDGRELEMFAASTRAEIEMWGVDHSGSAIARARARFPAHAERFLEADLADLERLDLPAFAVVLLLNVLQCTSVDRDRLLRDLKPLLTPDCRALVSIPNCHFGAHDILRRPLRRDDPRHDRSLVHKDLRYLTRELYRSGFQTVESFGTYDSFLLARR